MFNEYAIVEFEGKKMTYKHRDKILWTRESAKCKNKPACANERRSGSAFCQGCSDNYKNNQKSQ